MTHPTPESMLRMLTSPVLGRLSLSQIAHGLRDLPNLPADAAPSAGAATSMLREAAGIIADRYPQLADQLAAFDRADNELHSARIVRYQTERGIREGDPHTAAAQFAQKQDQQHLAAGELAAAIEQVAAARVVEQVRGAYPELMQGGPAGLSEALAVEIHPKDLPAATVNDIVAENMPLYQDRVNQMFEARRQREIERGITRQELHGEGSPEAVPDGTHELRTGEDTKRNRAATDKELQAAQAVANGYPTAAAARRPKPDAERGKSDQDEAKPPVRSEHTGKPTRDPRGQGDRSH